MKKRYWLWGGVVGLIAGIFIWFYPTIFCSDFYRIGPAYPTDQPICYSLIVNGRWIELSVTALILGIIIGWLYGKIKNRRSSVSTTNY